jgi:hypothetical protein
MTAEQKKWLDDHRALGWTPRGVLPGANAKILARAMLHPDGTVEQFRTGRPSVRQGSFEVVQMQRDNPPGQNPGF